MIGAANGRLRLRANAAIISTRSVDYNDRMPRRFQFSVRALLLFVLLASGVLTWIGHEASIVRQRRVILGVDHERDGCSFVPAELWPEEAPTIPRIRRKLGDVPIPAIYYFPKRDYDGVGLERVTDQFPEAEIIDISKLD